MAFSLSEFFFGAGRQALQGILKQGQPFVGDNPYEGEQRALLDMLMQSAQGKNSLAGQQYQMASQDAMARQYAMSRGRGAGAARNAQNQLGQIGQGMAAGVAEATLKERLGAMGQLQGSISAANQADYQRQLANQQMYQQALMAMAGQPGIGQQLLGLAGQGIGAYAMLRGPKGSAPSQPNVAGGMADAFGQAFGSVAKVGQGGFSPFGGSPGPQDPWA